MRSLLHFLLPCLFVSGFAIASISFACDEEEAHHSHGSHKSSATRDKTPENDHHSVWLANEDEMLSGLVSLHVVGMICSSCRAKLEASIKKIPEINTVTISLKINPWSQSLKLRFREAVLYWRSLMPALNLQNQRQKPFRTESSQLATSRLQFFTGTSLFWREGGDVIFFVEIFPKICSR